MTLKIFKTKILATAGFLAALCPAAFAEIVCDEGNGTCVPEIPASSAPSLLLGLLGSIVWIRNFFNKK